MMRHPAVLTAGLDALLIHTNFGRKMNKGRKIGFGLSLWRPDGTFVRSYGKKDRKKLIRDLSAVAMTGRRFQQRLNRFRETIGKPAPNPAALDGLLVAVAGDDPATRRGALNEIARIGHPGHAVLKLRLSALQDPEARRAIALVVAQQERYLRYLRYLRSAK